MANKNLTEKEKLQQEQVAVEETVSSVEKFFNENKKLIWGLLIGIVACGLIVLAVVKFYVQPMSAEAKQQMFPAEANFRAQNFELALNGDGNTLGFAQIVKEYGRKAGSVVYFYAGVCELELGNYENAIDYLNKYNGKDEILRARALSCTGDAYVGLEKYSDALSCFEKAAAQADNMFAAAYLLKAGVVCEEMGDNEKALALYKQIKSDYPQSMEAYSIDKYISRIENQVK